MLFILASFVSKALEVCELSCHFWKRDDAANVIDASQKLVHERAPRHARTVQFSAGAFPDDLLSASEQLATQRETNPRLWA